MGSHELTHVKKLSAFDNPFCFELNYNAPQPEARQSVGQVTNRGLTG
jgi:hypothetical protein